LTHRILEAGKHALTEKPLALSVEQIDALEALAVQQGLTLGVFYEMRYAPAHTPARKLIQGGAIGRIIGIQIQTLIDKPLSYWQAGYTGRSIHPWRGIRAQAGGGVVLMNTSHLLDALLYITGLRVTAVSAEVGTLLSDVEVEDMAATTIRFDNGAIGSLIAGAHISGARSEEFCRFYGTNGQIRLPDPYGTDPMQIYVKEAWGDLPGEQWHTLEMQPAPVYRLALEDFARAVQCQGPAPIDTSDARQVLTTVLSLYQSAVEKRTVSIS
jgi:predicted dehydrogenase